MVNSAPVRLHAPWYADPDDGCMLHRYLDEEFLLRFRQAALAGSLSPASAQAWRQHDRFGRHRDLPTLRLPLHRCFYVVCCEASCERPGLPALAPERIIDAGMVVRRGTPERFEVWRIEQGLPQGWQPPPGGDTASYDPDERRALRRLGLPVPDDAPPSGEAIHPLHPLPVPATGTSGQRRPHTLLFGYLPLGGSAPAPPTGPPPARDLAAHLCDLPWPFGHRQSDGACRPGEWDGARDGQLVSAGRPNAAGTALLHHLVTVCQAFDAARAGNAELRQLLAGLAFCNDPHCQYPTGETLLGYLDHQMRRAETLLDSDAVDEAALERTLPAWLARNPADRPASEPLPGLPPVWLHLTAGQAEALRLALARRGLALQQALEASLPRPRYGQGADDRFFVRPFLRYRDHHGCERIAWGPPSAPFRVAAPLDPEASRPVAIAMPEFSDLRRGLARGVSFLTPRSLANQLFRVKGDGSFTGGGPGNPLPECPGFSFSFSLPVVTFVAMLLLMVIVNLLNLVFFWLPWVFLRLCRR